MARDREKAREEIAAEDDRRLRRWQEMGKIHRYLMDDDELDIRSLRVEVSQVGGVGNYLCYGVLEGTLSPERLRRLLTLSDLYGFSVAFEQREGLRIWPTL